MSKYIRCDYCSKVNNINQQTLNNPIVTGYSCVHCSKKLDIKKLQEYKSNHKNKLQDSEEKNNIVFDTIKILATIAIIIFIMMKYVDYQNGNNSPTKDDFIIVQKPESGIHLDVINKERLAPFTIITNGYSNYYVKLKSITDKQKYITIFINKGDKISVKIPLGSYVLTYANGEEWYGTQYLFGKKSVHKAKDIFNFTKNQQTTYGHTVTLYNVANGNLQETTVNKNNF